MPRFFQRISVCTKVNLQWSSCFGFVTAEVGFSGDATGELMKTVLGQLGMRTKVATKVAMLAGALLMILAPTARAQDMAGPAPTSPPPPLASPGTTYSPAAPGMRGLSVWGIIPWGGYGAGARFMLLLPIPSLLAHSGTSLH